MLHGKKGFERIVWAFKNVLTSSINWLFYDLEAEQIALADARKFSLPSMPSVGFANGKGH